MVEGGPGLVETPHAQGIPSCGPQTCVRPDCTGARCLPCLPEEGKASCHREHRVSGLSRGRVLALSPGSSLLSASMQMGVTRLISCSARRPSEPPAVTAQGSGGCDRSPLDCARPRPGPHSGVHREYPWAGRRSGCAAGVWSVRAAACSV